MQKKGFPLHNHMESDKDQPNPANFDTVFIDLALFDKTESLIPVIIGSASP